MDSVGCFLVNERPEKVRFSVAIIGEGGREQEWEESEVSFGDRTELGESIDVQERNE